MRPDLVKETLCKARAGGVRRPGALATASLAFDRFVFGIVAIEGGMRNRALMSAPIKPRLGSAGTTKVSSSNSIREGSSRENLAAREARQFTKDPRHRLFLKQSVRLRDRIGSRSRAKLRRSPSRTNEISSSTCCTENFYRSLWQSGAPGGG